jgi:hypothetical protein
MTQPSTHVLELLEWLAREPRSHRETIQTWGSHCPRSTPWEDAQESGLVRVTRNGEAGGRLAVVLTRRGRETLEAERRRLDRSAAAYIPRSPIGLPSASASTHTRTSGAT